MDKKILFIKIFVLAMLIILIFRAGYLQLVLGNYYYQLSEGNRISQRPINAPRGKIIDSKNNILVSNKQAYHLYLLPNEISPNYNVETLLEKLSQLTQLDLQILKKNYQKNFSGNSSSPVILKRNISRETKVIVMENSDALPGILVKDSSVRDYVYEDLAPHIFGYVGEIGLEELKEYTAAGYDYKGGDIVGITGLEKQYEYLLRGIDGIEQLEVNSRGQKVNLLGIKPPIPGNNLILHMDLELQQYTEKVLAEKFYKLREDARNDSKLSPPMGAAAIVMDVNSGAILAMASIPKYNLNDFAERITYEEYEKLSNNELRPFFNRPIKAEVPSGSIFKVVTGTAAMEYLGITEKTIFNDKNGLFYVPNWSIPFKNWHYGGEGKLNFTKAIGRSNNVVFYQLGYRLYEKYKGEKLAQTARQYGLGSKTGIDLPGEMSGLVPDDEWKRKTKGEAWYPGDSVNLSIGQGDLKTTPIQLVTMISAIANGGILYKPYLVDKIVNSNGEIILDKKPEIKVDLPFKKSTLATLRKGMTEVTNASYGTASRVFKDFPVKIAGKTGTAQTGSSKMNHGFFAGFAPVERPEVAVLVFLEEGKSSGNTLPIAVEIFKKYFGIEENTAEQSFDQINTPRNEQNKSNQLLNFIMEVFTKNK